MDEKKLKVPVPVEGVAGGRLNLPCDITSPISDDEVYLVLWYKDEVATPIYSLDARRGPLGQARHATNEPLTGRAYFSSIPQPAVLQIDKVSLEDEGLYRCRVDFRKARTQHSALIVSIAGEYISAAVVVVYGRLVDVSNTFGTVL
ncbi:ig-like domain-containing protein [Caerostris darwini]|uniref:Ig-like domain-containing protein n=1 Tax=Caerostris darwini TaxID=1538125 RepID=A0AAV4V2G8_9ARAC|nr:ig-like domain-containing protein [Caerostris darwini]